MRVLATQPYGEADVQTLIKHIPEYVDLTETDRQPSETRPNEERWEQRVRNLKSHHQSLGNVIGEGFVEHLGGGRYRLTDAGKARLEGKDLLL